MENNTSSPASPSNKQQVTRKTVSHTQPVGHMNIKPKGDRPWQGTLLGILNIIGLAFLGLAILLMLGLLLFSGELMNQMAAGEAASMIVLLKTFSYFIIIPIVLFFVLGIFITKGIFKGYKWTIIVSIIFSGLAMLSALAEFEIFSILLNGGLIYLEVICLQHPFYNQKK